MYARTLKVKFRHDSAFLRAQDLTLPKGPYSRNSAKTATSKRPVTRRAITPSVERNGDLNAWKLRLQGDGVEATRHAIEIIIERSNQNNLSKTPQSNENCYQMGFLESSSAGS
jgi:hypothetical protein